ncbi:MAG: response regulator, partial [Ignavibacteria bacterium]|nr:response regulator [Ignavibacteria bacterium]
MKKILITEDEELLSQVYKDSLEKEGYEVIITPDGTTALNYLEKTKVDLAIMDVKLPDMSGLKLLEEARKKYPDLPIIMCSAYDAFRLDYEVWASKVSDYIVKP